MTRENETAGPTVKVDVTPLFTQGREVICAIDPLVCRYAASLISLPNHWSMRIAERQTALNTPLCARSIHGSLYGTSSVSSGASFDGPESCGAGGVGATLSADALPANKISKIGKVRRTHGLHMQATMLHRGCLARE